MRLLLTGIPGIGKTTIIRATLEHLEGLSCSGFYTEEKRHQGRRIAFRIVTLDGMEGTLASIDRGRGPNVGRYAVHVREFEQLVLPRIDPNVTPADLYVIDELGKMELLSQRFRTKVTDLLALPSHLLATIATKGKGFVEQIKRRNDVELIEVTGENRDRLPLEIARRVQREIASP